MIKKIKKIISFRLNIISLNRENKSVMINIGSGHDVYEGWITTDIGLLDVTNKLDWFLCVWPFKVDRILAEHVWEHLTPIAAQSGMLNCRKYLKKGGLLRLAVPDGLFPDNEYIEHVKPAGIGPGAYDHKMLYNYKTLLQLMVTCGLDYCLLEYWDEDGRFVENKWKVVDGMIKRSRRYDERNDSNNIRYTSLIIDGIRK
jgi:predicted SAM-dependent methyltransferase